jgi:hypothetical protein
VVGLFEGLFEGLWVAVEAGTGRLEEVRSYLGQELHGKALDDKPQLPDDLSS